MPVFLLFKGVICGDVMFYHKDLEGEKSNFGT